MDWDSVFFLVFLSQIFLAPSFVDEPSPHNEASIALPSELHDFVIPSGGNETRVQFNFYGIQKLFQVL